MPGAEKRLACFYYIWNKSFGGEAYLNETLIYKSILIFQHISRYDAAA